MLQLQDTKIQGFKELRIQGIKDLDLDFSAIFSEIASSKLINKGATGGAFLPSRGAILARPPTLRH